MPLDQITGPLSNQSNLTYAAFLPVLGLITKKVCVDQQLHALMLYAEYFLAVVQKHEKANGIPDN